MTRWRIVAVGLALSAALFGAALYFGWIGHRSMDWPEFRNQVAVGTFKELRVSGLMVKATPSRDENKTAREIVVYAPSDIELKALIYSADQHGVKVVLDKE